MRTAGTSYISDSVLTWFPEQYEHGSSIRYLIARHSYILKGKSLSIEQGAFEYLW